MTKVFFHSLQLQHIQHGVMVSGVDDKDVAGGWGMVLLNGDARRCVVQIRRVTGDS